ncbi:hypothetical protein [Arcicella rosea]|uniref:Uncharacterized protein n=1 Tax=Arcicella rosea TaxID=502909 RepID=A0A841ELW8_9BACT|nr:hypothetical protein [Arcicella rosea]MBB6005137.1 hypothetical protein [Arcicella rosea]
MNRTIFNNWCKEIKKNVNIKDTKQTFTPKEIKIIIASFGQPPFSTEQEKEYIKAILEQS